MAGNYYYVMTDGVNDGTATGDEGLFSSKQTGAFSALDSATAAAGPASYYATITAALAATTTPGDGDFICVSNTHALSQTGSLTYAASTSGAGDVLTILSVDKSNVENYLRGASETNTGSTDDVNFDADCNHYGIDWDIGDLIAFSNQHNNSFFDCSFKMNGSTNGMTWGADSTGVRFFDVDVDLDTANNYIGVGRGGTFEWYGGALSYTSATNGDSPFRLNAGGATLFVQNVDLSACDTYLLSSLWGTTQSTFFGEATLDLCKTHATLTGFVDGTVISDRVKVRITRCSSDANEGEYQYRYESRGGIVEEDTTNTRDASTAYEETNQRISLKVVTDANASRTAPFSFDFPTRYAELAASGSDSITIEMITTDALGGGSLLDTDVWAVATYPDGTTKSLGNAVVSGSSGLAGLGVIDPLVTGTAIPSSTDAWTETLTTELKYKLTIDTATGDGGDTGADCVPEIRLFVGRASATIYFCPTVTLS